MIRRSTDDRSLRQLADILAAADGAPRGPLGPIDWPGVLRLAASTLSPALWSAVRRLDLLPTVPPPLLEHLQGGPRSHPSAVLQAAHQHNHRRTVDLFDQLEEVLQALRRKREVRPVAVKGTAMVLAGVWPDGADRSMADIDLLVHPSGAATARQTLLGLGYEEARPMWPSLHHLPALRRPDRFGSFELHVRPMTNAWTAVLTADEVRDGAGEVDVGRSSVLVPSRETLATHALAHAHLSGTALALSAIPLRTTHEVWRLERLAGPIDWAVVRSRLARASRSRVVDRHQHLAAVLLDGTHDRRAERAIAVSLAQLRWPAVERGRYAAWRLRHLLDGHRLREFYGDERGPVALRYHHLRTLASRVRPR